MRIGVVCEGSTDFFALRAIFNEVASERGVHIDAFDAIQPKVDATSETQIGGGGWPRVKVWLEDNRGADLKKVLSPQIFSTSQGYDVLLIHLDGDVVGLCNDFDAVVRASCYHRPDRIVRAVEDYIEGILSPPDALDDSIIYAVPVMHTEAWLIAAASDKEIKRNLEHEKTKTVGQRYLTKRYQVELKQAAILASARLGKRLNELRGKFFSLEHFAARVDAQMG